MSQLTDFLEGKAPDHKGRLLSDLWQLDHFNLEYLHDYIQWLFPMDSVSRSNKHAPVLTLTDREYCQQSELIQQNQLKSSDLMLAYYGLIRQDNVISACDNLNMKQHIWLKRGGHNQLRITRIIRSLALCGNELVATSLQTCVLKYGVEKSCVQPKVLEFWQNAMSNIRCENYNLSE